MNIIYFFIYILIISSSVEIFQLQDGFEERKGLLFLIPLLRRVL